MIDKPASPFSGLDKALLRSTQPTSTAPQEEHQEASSHVNEAATQTPKSSPLPKQRQVHTRTNVSGHARTHAPTHTYAQSIEEQLYRQLQAKQRLSSSTFRFRPEELEELDKVLADVDPKNGRKVSKNDLVRLALNWLLTDYKTNGDESLLAHVLARI